MIKTKARYPVQIIEGSKKCITGNKPFTVRFIESQDQKIARMFNPYKYPGYERTFKITRKELVVEDENELYEAIGLKREG